jgi:hypothetical protein
MEQVIKLEPIRMGDLLKGSDSSICAGKYVPPNRRTGSEVGQVEKIDMGGDNFPALGAVPKKTGSWGKHVIKTEQPPPSVITPVKTGVSLSDKIKENIRINALEEELRMKIKEDDTSAMTNTQLKARGWNIISLDKISLDLSDDTLYKKYANAPHGMSFHEYTYYMKKKGPTPEPIVTPERVVEESEEESDVDLAEDPEY